MEHFPHLRWHKLRLALRNIRSSPSMPCPSAIFQSVVKNITNRFHHHDQCRIIFHVQNKGFSSRFKKGEAALVEVLFFGHDPDFLSRWREEASAYFKNPEKRNFLLEEISPVQERNFQDIDKQTEAPMENGEACLDFLSPLPFTPPAKKRRFFLSEGAFAELFRRRLKTLFGEDIPLPEIDPSEFHVLPYYWNFKGEDCPSKSNPGTNMIRGCLGKLYVKGDLSKIVPYLLIGSEIHIGGRLPYSYGYYRLLRESPPFLSLQLKDKNCFLDFARDLLSKTDKRFEEFQKRDEKWLEAAHGRIASGTYRFTPNQAFAVKKGDGQGRVIENLSLEDFLVQRFLLKIIQDPLDRAFEENSLGYRKGKSAEMVFTRIEKLLEEGYHFIVESDVENFFPSIHHEKLEGLLVRYFPEKDRPLIDFIMDVLRSGYVLDNRIVKRERGLALGSPLSPILANLYLDSFDERFLDGEAVLLRYADDFILMAKTWEAAEAAALRSRLALAEAELAPKESKTRIVSYSEGFYFLGRFFAPGAGNALAEETFKELKKILYITEPFVFLGVSGEALEIKRGKSLLETFPLRRLEAIIALERVSLSSGLVKRCADMKIPITLTLNSGYFVSTIKPDSKQYFDVVSAHAARFHSLSEAERLRVAQRFASGKIHNYMAFLSGKMKKSGKSSVINPLLRDLAHAEEKIGQSASVSEIRGHEGAAARKVFSLYNTLILSEGFHFYKRDPKEPDPINSLFNFGYYLLFTRINTLVRAKGLNPYLGFLHSEADRYESFVCDIEELFRASVDRFLIKIINLKVIGAGDFEGQTKGLFMTREKKKIFLELFERHLEEKRSDRKHSLIEAMEWQVDVIKKWALDGAPLEFYRWEDS
jgi:CRISPR-associated protein Cas1